MDPFIFQKIDTEHAYSRKMNKKYSEFSKLNCSIRFSTVENPALVLKYKYIYEDNINRVYCGKVLCNRQKEIE